MSDSSLDVTFYLGTQRPRPDCALCGKSAQHQVGCSHVDCPCRRLWTATARDEIGQRAAVVIASRR